MDNFRKLQDFLNTHPGIKISTLCREAGVSYDRWYKMLKGITNYTPKHEIDLIKLLVVTKKYGR